MGASAGGGVRGAPGPYHDLLMDAAAERRAPSRRTLADAREDRLFFAQVREDPRVEIEALALGAGETAVVVASGGCTALSLVAAAPGRVVAVDLNAAQNHLVELKAVAVAALDREEAVRFLGGRPAPSAERLSAYEDLRPGLSSFAAAYWDGRKATVADGVLNAGVTERFVKAVVLVVRTAIHPPSRIRRLLACATVEEQREFYRREWDNRRWRLLFRALLNRAVFRRAYDPAFFRHVENPSFARHFHGLIDHVLTEVPVADNYFVHHMLTGAYPEHPGGLPPYLQPEGAASVSDGLDRLELVDGSYGAYLATCGDATIDAFALSNICEWLDASQVDELFAEIVRTAVPGARLVIRNFVGWTEVPERWAGVVVEDRPRGEALVAGDRSGFQRRVAVCRIAESGG